MAMHGIEYCATATPWNMRDMVEKYKGALPPPNEALLICIFHHARRAGSFPQDTTIEVSQAGSVTEHVPALGKSGRLFQTQLQNEKPISVTGYKPVGKLKNLSPVPAWIPSSVQQTRAICHNKKRLPACKRIQNKKPDGF